MKHAAPVMKRQGGGSFISTASAAWLRTGLGPHVYSAAKAAVIHLTHSVAMELGERGVRVNCICPGGIATPIFGKAKLVAHTRELATLESLHPMQWAWYVEDGMDGVDPDSIISFDGDIELGVGVTLMWTPGHTDGNHSLVVNTPDGVWVSSENGISADNWQPELSKIPGVKRYSTHYGREIVPNANTLEDSLDQYDSMVKEKILATRAALIRAGCRSSRRRNCWRGSVSGPSFPESPTGG